MILVVPTMEQATQSADDNVWGGEDLKAHLDGEPYITQPISVTLLCTSELRRKENEHADK